MTKALTRIQEFLKLEASAGLVLMAMALLAMLFANTTLAPIYSGILDTNVRIGIASFEISKPALLWINDGLMAIFFFWSGWRSSVKFSPVSCRALIRLPCPL